MDERHGVRSAVVKKEVSRFRIRMECPDDKERIMRSFKRVGAQDPMGIAVVSGDELPHFFLGRVFQNVHVQFLSHGVTILFIFEMSEQDHESKRSHVLFASEESVNPGDHPSMGKGSRRDLPALDLPFS
jgi:hypothetical protein